MSVSSSFPPNQEIAIVTPSVRPESLKSFKEAWRLLFQKHGILMIDVQDADSVDGVKVSISDYRSIGSQPPFEFEFIDRQKINSLIYHRTDACRNAGFLALAYYPHIKYVITLDDDVAPELPADRLPLGAHPCSDPIEAHIQCLRSRVPISWFKTSNQYMRGFPYSIRSEAEVWVSHGVWSGVPDYDAPTQLVAPNPFNVNFYVGPIPRGCYSPICGMNLAFRIEALPYMYFSPMGPGVGYDRFADIWMGIHMKYDLDRLGKAVVTGHARIRHTRASNVFKNLRQEAKGLDLNERYWLYVEDPALINKTATLEEIGYIEEYASKHMAWKKMIKEIWESNPSTKHLVGEII